MKKISKKQKPMVGILMGSDSDWPTMKGASDILNEFDIPHDVLVASAHRNPENVADYARNAYKSGIRVIIGGAGGAAHLPGVIAAYTTMPVIGVPIESKALKGMESLLSIVQMPPGVPVATVSIGGGRNAGILAVSILASGRPDLNRKMTRFKASLAKQSQAKNKKLEQLIAEG
jgi:5-(carboxyamino)imidazole ribonucleotide mutase